MSTFVCPRAVVLRFKKMSLVWLSIAATITTGSLPDENDDACDLVRAESCRPLPQCGELLAQPSVDPVAELFSEAITGSVDSRGIDQIVDLGAAAQITTAVKGEPYTCFEAGKYEKVALSCPAGSRAHINFISFGNPSGTCGNYRRGDCDGLEAFDRIANDNGMMKYSWCTSCPNVLGDITCPAGKTLAHAATKIAIEYTCCDSILACPPSPVGSMTAPTMPPTMLAVEASAHMYVTALERTTPTQVAASLDAEGVGVTDVKLVAEPQKTGRFEVSFAYEVAGQSAKTLNAGKFCAGVTAFACVHQRCSCAVVSVTNKARRRLAAAAAMASTPGCTGCTSTIAFKISTIHADHYMPTAWWGISYAAVALLLHLGGAIAWLVLLFCDCPTKRGCCGALCAKPLCDACRSRAHGCDCGARDATEAYGDGPAPVASAAASTLDRRPIAVRCTPPPAWSMIPAALGVVPLAVLALVVISIAMGPAEYAPGEPLSMLVPGASFSATLAVFEGIAALVGVALATLAAVATFVPFRDGKSCAATCGKSEKAGKCGACIDTFAHLLRLKLTAGLCAIALFLSAFSILIVLLCAQMFIGRRGFELVHVLGLVLGHVLVGVIELAAHLALWRALDSSARRAGAKE